MERMEIIRDLRLGVFDVLVGINLLREGLDIPEVSLVAILDADKEGLLRSETTLIQTIGRAARNINGKVIMYADTVTRSMRAAIDETNRRRKIQSEYNRAHNITPKTVEKSVRDLIEIGISDKDETIKKDSRKKVPTVSDKIKSLTPKQREEIIEELTKEMKQAASLLEFEKAAYLRDQIEKLKALDKK